jgi:hypothetical protein
MTRRTALPLLIVLILLLTAATSGGQALYWDSPFAMDQQGARWPMAVVAGGALVALWEEVVPAKDGASGVIYLSSASSTDGMAWSYNRRFLGPIRYSGVDPGAEPQVYSAAAQPNGSIVVAAATSDKEITILSGDRNGGFQVLSRLATTTTTVSPTMFVTRTGGLLLFAIQIGAAGAAEQGSLALASSADARTWSVFAPFVATGETAAGIQLSPTTWSPGAGTSSSSSRRRSAA